MMPRLFLCTAAILLMTAPQHSVKAQDAPLDPLPLDASAAQAFASHRARASDIARHFANEHPLTFHGAVANEDNTTALIAHLQAITDDRDFAAPRQPPSREIVSDVLQSMTMGHGQVGTQFDTIITPIVIIPGRNGDYDMALKGLMVIAYRYRNILTNKDLKHILDKLVPAYLFGGHDPNTEKHQLLVTEDIPETENHMLMINSTRYLVNQLRRKSGGGPEFDNDENGLADWLLRYMHTIAKHDFLEFNSRPYHRLSLHALLNLHEFAEDEDVKTAAHMLLDYAYVKFAISSDRQRRLGPFRRMKENTNNLHKTNDILRDGAGDPLSGYFMAYSGARLPDGNHYDHFFNGWTFNGVLAGLAAYRPPPAAYILGIERPEEPFQHRFYHGLRPKLPGTNDQADGGVEIYYRSPSFMMTAGGMFLNSGYGGDEFTDYKQTAVAQATTLIPNKLDVLFTDLIRFEPYPDERRAVNTAVDNGFACGANLRPADKKILVETSTHAPSLTSHRGRGRIGWKGSGNQNLNNASIFTTSVMGFEGVEGVEFTTTTGHTSEAGPALASHGHRLFLAWRGAGNANLNLIFSDDGGKTFSGPASFGDTSDHAPAIASHNGRVFYAWTGEGDGELNVAEVALTGDTAVARLEKKITLPETSDAGPVITSHAGRLFLAYRGSGNEELNLIFSDENGGSWSGKAIFSETSDHAPALASHNGQLFMAWIGEGDGELNVARVGVVSDANGGLRIDRLENKVTLEETSDAGPALTSHDGRLLLAWKGSGNENLSIRSSIDGSFRPGPWLFSDLSDQGFYVAAYRTPVERSDQLDTPIESLGLLYAMEAGDLPFESFRESMIVSNEHLPERLAYGGHYTFYVPNDYSFECHLHPSLEKYRARAGYARQHDRIKDFTELPLVSGPYMSAPRGHDGFVEIRHPGCTDTPLVLDYRDPLKPVRRDNITSCPAPWIERAQALESFADHLAEAGEGLAARIALRDSVAIHRQLADVDQAHGLESAVALQQALLASGIDFSVPEGELLAWLNNPQYTLYPALAEGLLNLLDGRKLRKPVHIDVIAWNYEHAPGATSPRRPEDVDRSRLESAVLEAFMTRHQEEASDLEDLTE